MELKLVRGFEGVAAAALVALLSACPRGATIEGPPNSAPAAASPNEIGKIAFVRTGDEPSHVYVMNADGTAKRRLSTMDETDMLPRLSPDGSKIAFYRSGEGLHILGPGRSSRTLSGITGYFSWSPDGAKLAYGHNGIYIVNSDGSGVARRISSERDANPDWSRDGQKITFQRRRESGTWDIWIMDSDGTNQVRLTETPRQSELHPAWSPDGTRIAFDRQQDIWLTDADGQNQIRLRWRLSQELTPRWAPDGSRIVFSRSRFALKYHYNLDIYTMKPNGADRERLTTYPGKDWMPDWQAV